MYDTVCNVVEIKNLCRWSCRFFKLRCDASQNRSRVRTQERTLYAIYWVNELHEEDRAWYLEEELEVDRRHALGNRISGLTSVATIVRIRAQSSETS